jgi:cytochrome c oxidase subunit 4
MAGRTISVSTYVIVCVVLVLLTVLTTAVSFAHLPPLWHLVAGMVIGACKASLVVLFFMHALISSRVTWIVILVSCLWVGVLFVLTLTDYYSRGMIPFTPGH